jgi:hypothetical protein
MALPGFLKSKIAAPDILRLLWLWTIIGYASFGRVFYKSYRPFDLDQGLDMTKQMIGRDFLNVWEGARLVLAGKISVLYSVADYMSELHGFLGADYPQHNFSYPPHIVVVILIFGVLGYFPALALWHAAGFGALGKALRKAGIGWHVTMLTLLSPPVAANLLAGQNGMFTAACFLGGLYLCETAPIPAGILFGLLTMKPHLGILIPFVLLMRKNWKCIASAATTTALLVGLSMALYGVQPWIDYVRNVIPYQQTLMQPGVAFYHRMMPGPFFDLLNIAPEWAWLIHACIALPVFAAALWAVKREGVTARSTLIVALGTMIIIPYGFNYDMVAVAGAAAVYLSTLAEEFALVHLLYGLLWALPLAVVELKLVPQCPSASIIMIGSFALLCLRARHGENKNV